MFNILQGKMKRAISINWSCHAHSSFKVSYVLMIKPFLKKCTAESREEDWTAVIVSNKHLIILRLFLAACISFILLGRM